MYDPSIGKWISEDPSGFGGQDPNLGRYVGNSPLLFVDPTGLKRDDVKRLYEMAGNDPQAIKDLDTILAIVKANKTVTRVGTDTCVRWIVEFQSLQTDQKTFPRLRALRSSLIERTYTGSNPFTSIHAAIKIQFPNGDVAYLDQGYLGGEDHVFFEEDWPDWFEEEDKIFGSTNVEREERRRQFWNDYWERFASCGVSPGW